MNGKPTSTYGWIVLACFMLVIGVSQIMWLNFAAITSLIATKYSISVYTAGILTISFPFFYVIFSIPSGIIIDKYGYRKTILISTLLMSLFSLIRMLNDELLWLFVGQFGIAIIQPFIVNSLPKLVKDWFTEDKSGLAIGLGTVGFFLGMLLGLGLSPIIVKSYSLSSLLTMSSLISWVSLIIFYLFGKSSPYTHSSIENTFSFAKCLEVIKHKQILLLLILSLLAVGVFNNLMTWMQPILSQYQISNDQAGAVGAFMILAGIIGSIIIPFISDKLKKRRIFVIYICFIVGIFIYYFTQSKSFHDALLWGAILGFLFLPGYALLMTITEESVSEESVGIATGLVMMMGNLGGVALSLITEQLNSIFLGWNYSIWMMVLVMLVSGGLAFYLRESNVSIAK